MTNNKRLDKYLSLKKRVEDAQQKTDQADGALGEVMKQLENEFGCATLKEGKRKLRQLEKQETSSKEEFDTAVEQFENDWSEELEEEEE